MISRTFLFTLAGIAGVLALGLLTLVAVQQHTPYRQQRVGGAFAMTEMNGRPVTDRDLMGKPTAIAFGFSYCPEVCPTTLSMLSQAMGGMGRDVDRVNVVFVTVDPARDTADQMKLYLSSFDPHIRGFTGTEAQVAGITNAYHVFTQRVPTEGGGYTMNHSAGVMLFDARGDLVGQIPYDDTPDQALAKLSTLVQPHACLPGGPPRVDLWSGAKLAGCSS